MKKILTIFFLFSLQLCCQNYLNIRYNVTPEFKNALLNDIQEITFNAAGTEMIVKLTNATITNELISSIVEMTISANGNGEPLPIELTSFSASYGENEVILNWQTTTEVNNYGFDVERQSVTPIASNLSNKWEKIGFITGHGNSNSLKNYSFTDIPKGGGTFNYRLKQIDIDGKFEYSESISVELGIPNNFELYQNYPNPFNPATTIAYSLPTDGFVTMRLFDVLGGEVVSLVNEIQKAGNYSLIFEGSNYSSGVYYCKLKSGNYSELIKILLVK